MDRRSARDRSPRRSDRSRSSQGRDGYQHDHTSYRRRSRSPHRPYDGRGGARDQDYQRSEKNQAGREGDRRGYGGGGDNSRHRVVDDRRSGNDRPRGLQEPHPPARSTLPGPPIQTHQIPDESLPPHLRNQPLANGTKPMHAQPRQSQPPHSSIPPASAPGPHPQAVAAQLAAPSSQQASPSDWQTVRLPPAVVAQLQAMLGSAGIQTLQPTPAPTQTPQQHQQPHQELNPSMPPHLQPKQPQPQHSGALAGHHPSAAPAPSSSRPRSEERSRSRQGATADGPRSSSRGSDRHKEGGGGNSSSVPKREQLAKLRLLVLELMLDVAARASRSSRRPADDIWPTLRSLKDSYQRRWGHSLSLERCGYSSLMDAVREECEDACRVLDKGSNAGRPVVVPSDKLEVRGQEWVQRARRELERLETDHRRAARVEDLLRKTPSKPANVAPVDLAQHLRGVLRTAMGQVASGGKQNYGLDNLRVDFASQVGFRLDPGHLGFKDLPSMLRSSFHSLVTVSSLPDGSSIAGAFELLPGPEITQQAQQQQAQQQQQQMVPQDQPLHSGVQVVNAAGAPQLLMQGDGTLPAGIVMAPQQLPGGFAVDDSMQQSQLQALTPQVLQLLGLPASVGLVQQPGAMGMGMQLPLQGLLGQMGALQAGGLLQVQPGLLQHPQYAQSAMQPPQLPLVGSSGFHTLPMGAALAHYGGQQLAVGQHLASPDLQQQQQQQHQAVVPQQSAGPQDLAQLVLAQVQHHVLQQQQQQQQPSASTSQPPLMQNPQNPHLPGSSLQQPPSITYQQHAALQPQHSQNPLSAHASTSMDLFPMASFQHAQHLSTPDQFAANLASLQALGALTSGTSLTSSGLLNSAQLPGGMSTVSTLGAQQADGAAQQAYAESLATGSAQDGRAATVPAAADATSQQKVNNYTAYLGE